MEVGAGVESESSGGRGVVVPVPKEHSKTLCRAPAAAGFAYTVGQKNVALCT